MTPREIKTEARRFLRKSGALPPLAAMSALALLVAASCKVAVKAFFALPSIDFITAGSALAPDTPVGNVLTEQMTGAAYAALDWVSALACDLLMLALLAPLAAGLLLCVLRAVEEDGLPGTGARRGLSAYGAGGLGFFFSTARDYRRAFAFAAQAVFRAVIWGTLVSSPFWAVSERGGALASAAAYLPAGFPFLPAAIALSALFALLGFFAHTRRFAAAALYVGDPSLSLRGAARRSATLMRGHRAEAAALTLSFAGWWVIGFLTLGVVLALYALPYYLCCKALFLRRLER